MPVFDPVYDRSVQIQMGRLSDLESHLATLSALPDLAQASDYLSALSISNRPIQVAMGYQNQVCLRETLLFCQNSSAMCVRVCKPVRLL